MRAEVIYHGRVQGVGFRATAHDLALQHKLAGWVRNEAEGTVKLVVEGPDDEVDAFLAHVRTRMRDHITREELDTGDERGSYAGFEIRR
ncbi:MAG: acylphosphatase [Phycisphaerales bacterium]